MRKRGTNNATARDNDARPATIASQSVRIDLGPNFSRFIDAAGNLMTRVQWRVLSPTASNTWQVSIDQAVWPAGL